MPQPPSRKFLLGLVASSAGVLIALALAEGVLRLGSVPFSAAQRLANSRLLGAKRVTRVLCLGESTTQRAYPAPLQEILNGDGRSRQFAVFDEGQVGTNSGLILNRLPGLLDKYNPDVVVTMVGINDADWSVPVDADAEPAGAMLAFIKGLRVVKLVRLALGRRTPPSATEDALLSVPDRSAKATRLPNLRYDFVTGRVGDGAKSGSERFILDGSREAIRDRDYPTAEKLLESAVAINPRNGKALRVLGELKALSYRDVTGTVRCLLKAVALDPADERTRLDAAAFLFSIHQFDEAEKMIREQLRRTPGNDRAWTALADCLFRKGDAFGGAAAARTAVVINPRNADAHLALARCEHGLPSRDVEPIFRRAVELDPGNFDAWMEFGKFSRRQGAIERAIGCFRIAQSLRPKESIVRIEILSTWYERKNAVPGRDVARLTADNYRRIRDQALRRGAKLVAVQYPTLPVRDLKAMLGEGPDLHFVDNEGSFKESVRRDGYWTYFNDQFRRTWGHCTPAGNRLLAANIARVILGEIFPE